MSALRVSLFGKFEVTAAGNLVGGFGSTKAEELFCYLVLHRDRPHPREFLASLLWDECTTSQSKAYLRKIIWQLQNVFDVVRPGCGIPALRVDSEWLRLDTCDEIWIDVAELEKAFQQVRGQHGAEMSEDAFRRVQSAVTLYSSDLLENWYQHWCLQRRERLQYMYLVLLDKLMDYCDAHDRFELGIDYGDRILAIDEAREHTHRRLMQLRYRAGDRTGAIRQYERCRHALEDELNVHPSQNTFLLYEQIRSDTLLAHPDGHSAGFGDTWLPAIWSHLERIKTLQHDLQALQSEIRKEIAAVEDALQR